MRKAFEQLLDFHAATGSHIGQDGPMLPGSETTKLCLNLIEEEYAEVVDAILEGDLPEIADGLSDLIYVALFSAVCYGIDLPEIWEAVHAANMDKAKKTIRRDDGKILKPEGWQHPDIAALIREQQERARRAG